MLFRWIILLLVGYLIYRFLRGVLTSSKQPKRTPPQEIQDEMVQDPVCKVYLPKRQAKIINNTNGINYYFCSTRCREKFIQEAKDRGSA